MKNALFTLVVTVIVSHASAQKMLYNDSLLLCSGKKTLVQVTYQEDTLRLFLDSTASFYLKGKDLDKLDDSLIKHLNKPCNSPGSLSKTLDKLTDLVSDRKSMKSDVLRTEKLNSSMTIVEKLDTLLARYQTLITTDEADINLLSYTGGKYSFDTGEIQNNDAAVGLIDKILLFMSKNTEIHLTYYLVDLQGKSYLIFNPAISKGKVTGSNRLEINLTDANKYRGDLVGTTTDSIPGNVYAANMAPSKDESSSTNQSGKPNDSQIDYSAENTDILLLTAYNFDFTSTVKSNYVGMLNIRSTNIGGTRWAINGGFTKINYSLGDYAKDSTIHRVVQNFKQNPLDTSSTGYTYYRQLNQYSIVKTTNSWSLFGQVLLELTNKKKHKIFAHVHSELFISKYTTHTEITTIVQDTLVADASTPMAPSNINGNSQTSAFSSLDGYFGAGATGLFNFSSKTILFVQPTFGWVVFGAPVDFTNFSSPSYAGNYRPNRSSGAFFYLVKFSLSQKISNKNSAIVVGSEIRGYLPNKIPQFAIYGGVTVDFADLAKIF